MPDLFNIVKSRVLLFTACLITLMTLIPLSEVRAQDTEDVFYDVFLWDDADLLTDEEEDELYDVMADGTEYGNMVFVTTDHTEGYKTKDYIEKLYQTTEELAGTDAVIYMIDMDNRMLWITGYGKDKKIITPDYGNLITDNVYKYAKDGDYATCAINGFSQIYRRLAGSRVSGPLRGVGNLCIAVILSEILCFVVAYVTSTAKKTKNKVILANIEKRINISNPQVKKKGTRKIYDPPKSSSHSSSGGGRSSGGGGGFSGGGGGHGF